jgi:hypothetical protein
METNKKILGKINTQRCSVTLILFKDYTSFNHSIIKILLQNIALDIKNTQAFSPAKFHHSRLK